LTLHIHDDITQGTPEWFAVRRGIVTASVIGKLLTPTLKVADNETARGITASLVAERISGHTEEIGTTPDMWRGIESEPVARDLYSKHYAPAVEVGFMVVQDDRGRRFGYSPDGLVGDDGLIEIKAPRAKTHLLTILADEVPHHYLAQCQAGLYVSGRAWIDFVSYCGGMPLFVKRVLPEQRWFDAIEAAWDAYEANAERIVADYAQRVVDMPTTERIDFNTVELRLA
jgi:putative phage-type endonuclease